MIAVLITDYERALLDKLREDAQIRSVVNGLPILPATAEKEQEIRDFYNNDLRRKRGKKPIDEAEAAANLANRERVEEKLRLSYKAGGYKEPYEFGKGRVKVYMESIEWSERETTWGDIERKKFNIITKIEELETDIEEGLDAIDTAKHGFFGDGSKEAYENAIAGGAKFFGKATGGITFISAVLREKLAALREEAIELYRS